MYTVDKYRSTFFRTTSSTYRLQIAGMLKKQLRSNQRGFANIQKVPLHLIFFCFITVMRFYASVAAKKEKKITVDKEAQHPNIVMYVCKWSLSVSSEDVDGCLVETSHSQRSSSILHYKNSSCTVYLKQSSPRKLFLCVMRSGGGGASSCSRSFGFTLTPFFFFLFVFFSLGL